MGCCEQDNQGPEATARPPRVSNQGGAPHMPRARPHPHSHPTHHIQRVEPGERGSDASNGLGAAGQQLLQGPRAAQLLLHLLGAGQLGGDVGALHCPRPLQQQPRLPVLRERESDRPITARFSLPCSSFFDRHQPCLAGTGMAWRERHTWFCHCPREQHSQAAPLPSPALPSPAFSANSTICPVSLPPAANSPSA